MRLAPALAVVTLGVVASACGDDEGGGSAEPVVDESGITADRCLVYLHGKGSQGATTTENDGVATIRPTGNAEGWGAREWRYFPDDRLAEATEVVRTALDTVGCESALVHGFSNGGAFVGALVCAGETFGGRVVDFVVDDPVVDEGTADCAPAADVAVSLYWTGGLDDQSVPGAECGDVDWTCEGDTLVGVAEYASRLGVEARPSRFDEHLPDENVAEVAAFLDRTET